MLFSANKRQGELWRTKGGCPIFRLPLAGSCTGHTLQGRTRNLSTTSHFSCRDGSNPPTLIHWPELQSKEITPPCFQTHSLGILKAPRTSATEAERAKAAWAAHQSPAGCRGSAQAVALQTHPSNKKSCRIAQRSPRFILPWLHDSVWPI